MHKGMIAALAAAGMAASAPVLAQASPAASTEGGLGTVAALATEPTPIEPTAAECELHVWPTGNYRVNNIGLFAGLGVVGGLVDHSAQQGKNLTVRDILVEQLGPDAQRAELERIGLHQTLNLPEAYRIVFEEPLPARETLNAMPPRRLALLM